MRYILTIFLLFASFTDPVTRIAKVNGLKKDAKEAIEAENYVAAVLHYIELVDSLEVDDDVLKFNMANAAYNLSYGLENLQFLDEAGEPDPNNPIVDVDTTGTGSSELKFAVIAENKYLELINSPDKAIASSSFNQRGIIAYIQSEKEKGSNKEGLFGQSLEHFKNSLRNNPANDAARYNYELLKKIKREQDQQDQEEDVKPSEYAKKMKAKADEQRRAGNFIGAMETMSESMQKDETTKAYQQFITKLQKVAAI